MNHSETLTDLQQKMNIKLQTMLIERETTFFFKIMNNILFVGLTVTLWHQVLKVHALEFNAFLDTLFKMFDDSLTRLG